MMEKSKTTIDPQVAVNVAEQTSHLQSNTPSKTEASITLQSINPHGPVYSANKIGHLESNTIYNNL